MCGWVDGQMLGEWTQAEVPARPPLGLGSCSCPGPLGSSSSCLLGQSSWWKQAFLASKLVSMAVGAAKTSRQEMPSHQYPGNRIWGSVCMWTF